MSITPQAIKDQEFQTKFRGYDTIEVKAYLELIAEEFFELQEEDKVRREQHDSLVEEKDVFSERCTRYELELEELKREKAALATELKDEQQKVDEIRGEMDELQTVIADLEQEKGELEEEVSAAEARIKDAEEAAENERSEKNSQISKVELLEQQIHESKQEELDFKTTLSAAQKFAQEIKEKSEEEAHQLREQSKEEARLRKEESEQEAKLLREKAEADVQEFREVASEELARIPQEIAELNSQRKKVRDELKTVLESHLADLNSFEIVDEESGGEGLASLYEKITSQEDGTFAPEDIARVERDMAVDPLAGVDTGDDELDNMEMDLGLPFSLSGNDENGE